MATAGESRAPFSKNRVGLGDFASHVPARAGRGRACRAGRGRVRAVAGGRLPARPGGPRPRPGCSPARPRPQSSSGVRWSQWCSCFRPSVAGLQLVGAVSDSLAARQAVRPVGLCFPASSAPRRRAPSPQRRVDGLVPPRLAVVALDLVDHRRLAHSAIRRAFRALTSGSSDHSTPRGWRGSYPSMAACCSTVCASRSHEASSRSSSAISFSW
jgi:hypothetical protein